MLRNFALSLFFLTVLCVASKPVESRDLTHTTSFVAFGADTNANPPMVFGGKLVSEMDRCAAIAVKRFLYRSKTASEGVTAGISEVTFHKPAVVKDLLFVTATVTDVGSKSIKLRVTVEREDKDKSRVLITSGIFVFVAFDSASKKTVEHGLTLTD